ncbi:MAG: hypothetical protein U0841_32245 [Chloroflexia bacterium]
MVARTLDTTRGDAAVWTVRGVGLGSGLVAVLGAVLLGWIAWPALIGGLLGGVALMAFLFLYTRTSQLPSEVAPVIRRRIREQAPVAAVEPDARIAA